MDYKKANEIARKIIKNGIKSATNEENNFARKIYKEITGESWRGCSDCWGKLYYETEIKLLEISTNKQTTMAQFKLKPNKLIQMHGFDPIGEKNLTDEIAMKILKVSKAHIRSFASFPENWESLTDGFNPAPVK